MTKYTRRIVYPSPKVDNIKNQHSVEASPNSGYRHNPIANRTKFDLNSQRNLLMSQTKLGQSNTSPSKYTLTNLQSPSSYEKSTLVNCEATEISKSQLFRWFYCFLLLSFTSQKGCVEQARRRDNMHRRLPRARIPVQMRARIPVHRGS